MYPRLDLNSDLPASIPHQVLGLQGCNILPSFSLYLKGLHFRGWQDGSVGRGACCPPWLQDSHGVKNWFLQVVLWPSLLPPLLSLFIWRLIFIMMSYTGGDWVLTYLTVCRWNSVYANRGPVPALRRAASKKLSFFFPLAVVSLGIEIPSCQLLPYCWGLCRRPFAVTL